jgi:hypothetical protein
MPAFSLSSSAARRKCREYSARYCPVARCYCAFVFFSRFASLALHFQLRLHQLLKFVAAGLIERALGIEARGGLQF